MTNGPFDRGALGVHPTQNKIADTASARVPKPKVRGANFIGRNMRVLRRQ